MHHDQPIGWYVERRLHLPISDAIPALDLFALHASLRPASPYACLLARAVANRGPAPPNTASRTFTGRMRLGTPVRAVPVELNLTAWSHGSSALGLRPTCRRPPANRRTGYFASTYAVLDDITVKLDLLTRLDGGPRSDAAGYYARVLTASPAAPTVSRLDSGPR